MQLKRNRWMQGVRNHYSTCTITIHVHTYSFTRGGQRFSGARLLRRISSISLGFVLAGLPDECELSIPILLCYTIRRTMDSVGSAIGPRQCTRDMMSEHLDPKRLSSPSCTCSASRYRSRTMTNCRQVSVLELIGTMQ